MELSIGGLINHTRFGVGKILDITKDATPMITVTFDEDKTLELELNQDFLSKLKPLPDEPEDSEEDIDFDEDFSEYDISEQDEIPTSLSITSFPCSETYDLVNELCVHVHPVKRGYPFYVCDYLMVRATGGISDKLYKVIDSVELNPFDHKEIQRLSIKFAPVKEFIRKTIPILGYKRAPAKYRFYLLKPIYTFDPPYVMNPNPRNHRWLSFEDVGLSSEEFASSRTDEAFDTNTHEYDESIIGSSKNGNIAIKCNYCDGGNGADHIGFSGICSDRIREYNIEDKKRAWCTNNNCPCYQFYKHRITREQLETPGEFVCYESTMLSEWKAQAGLTEVGEAKHFGSSLHKGAACVFTTLLPNMNEKDRFVFGIFIIDELFYGDSEKSGYVKCNTQYHIELKPNEALKIKYWNYYRNKNHPEMEKWGQGLYRFISNQGIIRILLDIVKIRTGESKQEVISFLNEFCRLNNLPVPGDVTYDKQSMSISDNVFLITWNPYKWNRWPGGYASIVKQVNSGKSYTESWTFSNSEVKVGDTCYLMRLGEEPRGIVAKGVVKSGIYQAPHYDLERARNGETTDHVDVEFTEMIDYESDDFLRWEDLKAQFPQQMWTPQSSGIIVRDKVVSELKTLWELTYSSGRKEETREKEIISITEEQAEASEALEYKSKLEVEELVSEGNIGDEHSYTPKPEERAEVTNTDNKEYKGAYPRDPQKKINALIRSGYTCEMCPQHESFISKRTRKRYVETHHIIPLEFWESFEYSLDVEANIATLCSNCHNEIHYGVNAKTIIEKLYEMRSKELEDAGIGITKEQLIAMYEGAFTTN